MAANPVEKKNKKDTQWVRVSVTKHAKFSCFLELINKLLERYIKLCGNPRRCSPCADVKNERKILLRRQKSSGDTYTAWLSSQLRV